MVDYRVPARSWCVYKLSIFYEIVSGSFSEKLYIVNSQAIGFNASSSFDHQRVRSRLGVEGDSVCVNLVVCRDDVSYQNLIPENFTSRFS